MRHFWRTSGLVVFGLLAAGCSHEEMIVAGDGSSVVAEETVPLSSPESTEADPSAVLSEEELVAISTSVPAVEEPETTTTVVSVLDSPQTPDGETLVPLSTELLFAALPPLAEPPPDHADAVRRYPWDVYCSDLEIQELNQSLVFAVFVSGEGEFSHSLSVGHVWMPGEASLDEAIARLERECLALEVGEDEVSDVEWSMSGGFKLARYAASASDPFSVQYRYDSDVLSIVVSNGPQTAERDLLASDWLGVSVERLDWMRTGGFVPSDTASD